MVTNLVPSVAAIEEVFEERPPEVPLKDLIHVLINNQLNIPIFRKRHASRLPIIVQRSQEYGHSVKMRDVPTALLRRSLCSQRWKRLSLIPCISHVRVIIEISIKVGDAPREFSLKVLCVWVHRSLLLEQLNPNVHYRAQATQFVRAERDKLRIVGI